MNQIEEIQKHLEAGNAISPLQALALYGCFRLSARIHELRRKGMEINTKIIKSNKKHFAEYRMVAE